MRAVCWSGLLLLLLLVGSPAAVQADEGERQPAAKTADVALQALKLRMEARIKEGELLSKSGRLEEALEAYRSVGKLYERGMQEVRALIAALGAQPARVPIGKGQSAGGPFASRGRGGVDRPSVSDDEAPRVRVRAADGKASIAAGLAWLAAHQGPDGRFGASDFANWCDGKPVLGEAFSPDGRGKAVHDVGTTGLAVLAFLGAGHTNRGKHPYAKVVGKALRYLKSVQDPEGCFGPRATQQYIYHHGIASLAMVEAYAMTRSPIFKGSAQRALDFIAVSRNPYMAWRYGVKPGDNDTSVTTWMVMALKSAKLVNEADVRKGHAASLTIDETAFDGARAWLDKVTDPDYGRVGYNQRGSGPARTHEMVDKFPSTKSEAMTAAGILMRVLMGEDPRKSALVTKGASLVSKLPPTWNTEDGSIDMYYWYYGTLAMYQVGGRHWANWNKALDKTLRSHQRMEGSACMYKGSWDPVGPWGLEGGRVASTAMMIMCLEVSYRHARVLGVK